MTTGTISTEFSVEGNLEIWAFEAKGRRRIDIDVEPDEAVALVTQLTEQEERSAKMREDLKMPPQPRVYAIVEHVETRKVWAP